GCPKRCHGETARAQARTVPDCGTSLEGLMHLGFTTLKSGARTAHRAVVHATALVGLASGSWAMAAPAPTSVNGNQFFDWFIISNPAPANVVPAPFLSDGNAGSVNTFLSG